MPKLQFLKLSGEVGGFAQRHPPPPLWGCRESSAVQNDPITATEPESGEFRIVLGRKTEGRENKQKKQQKTTPKKQENLRTFCCYTTRLSERGVMWMGWKKNDPKSEAEKCSPFVNLSPTLNSGLI